MGHAVLFTEQGTTTRRSRRSPSAPASPRAPSSGTSPTSRVPDPVAHLAAELGVLAFKRGFAEWTDGDRDVTDDLSPYTIAALDELRAASASLG